MFTPTRDQARDLFFETWRKYRAGQPLEGLEKLVVGVLTEHPEFHEMLDAPERYKRADYDGARTNPFLHLSLHLAVEEQLSIDQPPGVRAAHQQLVARHGSEHEARHHVMACLVETLRDAQTRGGTFDTPRYLACLEERSKP
ncbi:MAG: DUF1841 family protein [Burkholderiales bacterium]|nr:DUF1841 family protein [Burkholderiales bacterium]